MEPIVILDDIHFNLTINRLCYELIENHGLDGFENTVLIGLQPRGVYLSHRISERLKEITGLSNIEEGRLDITFYRDDFRRRDYNIVPSVTEIDFIIEDKKVILIDDVLYSGRTIRAGMDALMAYGRPSKVELLVLVDRRFNRSLPIWPDYVGKHVDTINEERVNVTWKEQGKEDQILLYRSNNEDFKR